MLTQPPIASIGLRILRKSFGEAGRKIEMLDDAGWRAFEDAGATGEACREAGEAAAPTGTR